MPHHVTQRGNRRQQTFFCEEVRPLLEMFGDWREYLTWDIPEEEVQALRRYERTGRPLGGEAFLADLEETLGRTLRPRKSGPKGPRRKELNR